MRIFGNRFRVTHCRSQVMIFERIDVEKGSFSTGELNPTPEEVKQKVYETILAFKP